MAIVVDSAEFGGAEVYVDHLLRHLPPEIPRFLVVRTPGPAQLIRTAQELKLDVVAWSPSMRGLARLERVVRTAGLVHLNMAWPGANRAALARTAMRGGPTLATLHLYIPPRNQVRKHILRLAFRGLQRVIVVSRPISDLVASGLAVDPSLIRLVPNGVPLRRLGGGLPVPTPGAVMRIGAVGRLTTQKGFDLLLSATRTLVDEGRQIEVSIAGDGPERARLREAGRGLPVRFLGPVDDIERFLSEVDVFCLPSRFEGLPFALLEAMMAGKACVAADVGDVAEALGSGGIVAPPEDPQALAWALGALADAERRDLLGLAAHRRAVDAYTLDRMIDRTAEVYREIWSAH